MRVYMRGTKNTVPFGNLAPGDCFTTPDNNKDLLMRIMKIDTFNVGCVNAINLKTGATLYFRKDDKVYEEKGYVVVFEEGHITMNKG